MAKGKETKKFYTVKKIRAENGTSVGRIDIYGEISSIEWWGDETTPAGLVEDLKALGTISEIECHIFSNGDDMFAGLAIYNILHSRPEPVSVYIEGIAASAATIIACSGDKVYMSKSDMMFYHNMMTGAWGNEHDMREVLDEMVKLKEAYIVPYMDKSGKSREEIIALLDGENKKGTWLTADEAISFGLVDSYTPINKMPLEVAACISPGVFNYRGHKIDFSAYDKAAEKTAEIINSSGGNLMAFNLFGKKKGKPAAKKTNVKPKTEITFVEMVCPSCSGAVNMNPETGEIFAGGAQVEQQAGSQNGSQKESGDEPNAMLARRLPGNTKAAIYSVDCPHCGEPFVWDTDLNADGEAGTTATPATPLGGAAAPGPAQKPTEQQAEPSAEAAQAACPNCGINVDYDTETAETGSDEETGTEGYVLTCTACNTQFIEPFPAADPNAVPVGASVQAAYQAGVMAERNRQASLDEMAMAAPALAGMIQAAKKSGTTAETMSRNVIRAMAQGKAGTPSNLGATQFAAAFQKDLKASNVNSMRKPAHADAPKTVQASAYERRIEEHNKARRGEENG